MSVPINIDSVIHPVRSFIPCSGVGRHINGMLDELKIIPDVNLRLIYSKQWLKADGKLPLDSPQRDFESKPFGLPENLVERWSKLFKGPAVDRWFAPADFVYCPAETYLSLKRIPWGPTIHDIHPFEKSLPWSNSKNHIVRRNKWRRWLPQALDDAALIFTVSHFTKRRMVELLGADEKKIVVTGNAIDPSFLNLPLAENRSVTRPYLVVVGGLKLEKGAPYVLELAELLEREKIDCTIRVVGSSSCDWSEKAKSLANVVELGVVSDDVLRTEIANASVMLYLSLYEGFGIPPLEAMALGTTVVAANAASLPEVMGGHGHLVDPTDTKALVSLVRQLLCDPVDQRSRIAAQRYANGFRWEDCGARLFSAISEFVQ